MNKLPIDLENNIKDAARLFAEAREKAAYIEQWLMVQGIYDKELDDLFVDCVEYASREFQDDTTKEYMDEIVSKYGSREWVTMW
ncbi:hypothetical protein CHOTACABRAS_11 [Bacillus phage Chotacabras]|nr:hypothetical protein CHOTACABRAS_11 [Bacillus phage Chotacabras]